MRLTWRDAVSTVLVLAGLAMALSVIEGWGWPLLGGVREGIVAAGITGVAACLLGSSLERSYFADPFGLVTLIIGMAVIGIAIVGGLIFGTQEFLLALMLVIGMLWVLATVRHAVEGAVPEVKLEGAAGSAPAKRAFG
jgi:hypothetical protein